MSNTNTGGPAFPFVCDADFDYGTGMTLRDYFAAAFVSSGHVFIRLSPGDTPEEVAEQSYALADAMLKARTA